MKAIEDILATHPFFRGLRPEYLTLIAGCASNAHFKPGEYLAREGEAADRFYAIREGTAAVEVAAPDRGPLTVQTITEGDLVGWSWLYPPYRWTFDVRATVAVRSTAFDGKCLREKCDGDPALGYELMKRLAGLVSKRLEGARLQLLDLYAPRHA